MLKNFRTYHVAVEFYQECKKEKLPYFLKDQLMRASSSIALNLAEGCSKPSVKDRRRFYSIAFASLREVQSIIQLENVRNLITKADHLAANLYKLTHS